MVAALTMFASTTAPIGAMAASSSSSAFGVSYSTSASSSSLEGLNGLKSLLDTDLANANTYTKYVLNAARAFTIAIPSGKTITTTATYQDGTLKMTALKRAGNLTSFAATYTKNGVDIKVTSCGNTFVLSGEFYKKPATNLKITTMKFTATSSKNSPTIRCNYFVANESDFGGNSFVANSTKSSTTFGESYSVKYTDADGNEMNFCQGISSSK